MHDVPAGKGDVQGDHGALVGARRGLDLDQHRRSVRRGPVTQSAAERQEGGTVEPDVDESAAGGPVRPLHAAEKHRAERVRPVTRFRPKVDDPAVVGDPAQQDAGVDVDQQIAGHTGKPRPRRAIAVSCSGRPTTLLYDPDIQRTKTAARP